VREGTDKIIVTLLNRIYSPARLLSSDSPGPGRHGWTEVIAIERAPEEVLYVTAFQGTSLLSHRCVVSITIVCDDHTQCCTRYLSLSIEEHITVHTDPINRIVVMVKKLGLRTGHLCGLRKGPMVTRQCQTR
jgi:hypothetical protein